jgi:hypothetical protein
MSVADIIDCESFVVTSANRIARPPKTTIPTR